MNKIIIIGAGAIGRGYLPWVFRNQEYDLIFIDNNPSIVDLMNQQGSYKTYCVKNHQLEEMKVTVAGAYLPQDFQLKDHSCVAAVFINVGPRNAAQSAQLVNGLTCPILLCENDPATVEDVKAATSLQNVFFAVPDVITSNTAPPHLLEKDPLSIVTEDGVLFIDSEARDLKGEITWISTEELLNKQWPAKLYLHNTPHCIAAYLGAVIKVTYVHDAMAVSEIDEIVQGAMDEMLSSLKLKWDIPHEFLDAYAEKELRRFRNQLLFDPISRVAREPLRKLEVDGRLIGAAQICLSQGFIPQNILVGIASALLFHNLNDSDHHLSFMRRSLSTAAFVTHILKMRKGEALQLVFEERLPSILNQLENLVKIPENSLRENTMGI